MVLTGVTEIGVRGLAFLLSGLEKCMCAPGEAAWELLGGFFLTQPQPSPCGLGESKKMGGKCALHLVAFLFLLEISLSLFFFSLLSSGFLFDFFSDLF